MQVHCELGPVLVNRTAVYKMCKAVPGELARRGFRVRCSALFARLGHDAEPINPWDARLFSASRRWLHWAINQPGYFRYLHCVTGWLPRWQQGNAVPLFLDPLYMLFYGRPDRGVVIVYDTTTVTEPGWHHPGVSRLYDRAFDVLAQSCCQVVATCRQTADELRVNWGIAPSRLTILPLGLFTRPSVVETTETPDESFLLFVGSMEPRKNVGGLLQAYAESGLFMRGIHLWIVGSLPPENDPVLALARATPGVKVKGFIPDAELAAAYERCLAFVYPSFCEGFGLPLLEAMSRGCVCLSTMLGASPEIAGDAAVYVNPYCVAEIVEGLHRVAGLTILEREQLARRAQARSREFTWERFHDGLARVLRRAS